MTNLSGTSCQSCYCWLMMVLLVSTLTTPVQSRCLHGLQFSDVGSLTTTAAVVFEGGLASDDVDGDVEFRIGEIFKGADLLTSTTSVWVQLPSVDCADSLRPREHYLVFLAESESTGDRRPTTRWMATPTRFSRREARIVQEYSSCSDCGRRPRSAVVNPDTVYGKFGHPLELSCHGNRHIRPPPVVSWFKDGVAVIPSDRVHIETTRRSSMLFIEEAEVDDAGEYSCHVTNVLGSAVSDVSRVSIANPASSRKPHSRLCDVQYYCLNLGTCYVLLHLNVTYCECPRPYTGQRCENIYFDESTGQASMQSSLAFGGLLVGLVVVVLLICVTYFVIKLYAAFRKHEAQCGRQLRPPVTAHVNGTLKNSHATLTRQYSRSTQTTVSMDDGLPFVVITSSPPAFSLSDDVDSRSRPPVRPSESSSVAGSRSSSPRRSRLSAVSFAPSPVIVDDASPALGHPRTTAGPTATDDPRRPTRDNEQEQMRVLLRDLGVDDNVSTSTV